MVRMDAEDEEDDDDDDAKLWDSRVGLLGTLVARYIITIVSNRQCHCESKLAPTIHFENCQNL